MNNINNNVDIKVTRLINAVNKNIQLNKTGFSENLSDLINELGDYLITNNELMQPLINSLENIEQKLPNLTFNYKSKFVMKDLLEYNKVENSINISSETTNHDIDLERYLLKIMIEMTMTPEPGKELINSGLAMMIANNVMLNSNNYDIDNNYDESNYIEYLLVNQLANAVGFENIMSLSFSKNLEAFKTNLSNVYRKEDIDKLFVYFDAYYNNRNMKEDKLLSEIQVTLTNMYCKKEDLTLEKFNDFVNMLVTKNEFGKTGVNYSNLSLVTANVMGNSQILYNNQSLNIEISDHKEKRK